MAERRGIGEGGLHNHRNPQNLINNAEGLFWEWVGPQRRAYGQLPDPLQNLTEHSAKSHHICFNQRRIFNDGP